MTDNFYKEFKTRIDKTKEILKRPMTVAEKVLYSHLYNPKDIRGFKRGDDYVNFRPDRVAMQDATAQMALLQFMNSGRTKSMALASVHCDHLIRAFSGAKEDLDCAERENEEVYSFLKTVSSKYGVDCWKPGAGIIHQVIFENYSFPGGMMIGADSHTPNAGGLGMVAIGVGGADIVDVMTGMEWELKMPKLLGIKLTGKLNGWSTAKDIILKVVGMLTVKGGTNYIIEYFGDGVKSISATGRATITNMGAEVGATTSIFSFDEIAAEYLISTGRDELAKTALMYKDYLSIDDEVVDNPEKYFDKVIEINLDEVEPYVNGPFTPDIATPISKLKEKVKEMNYPDVVEVGLVGSCTNSSYEDLSRAASVAIQVDEKNLEMKGDLIINPGSDLILSTIERDGILDKFKCTNAVVMANACGPCIGQWDRKTDDKTRRNSIVTSFNRNFAKRADGNANTHAFITSPEITTALTIAGSLLFNPLTDTLKNKDGKDVKLDPPKGEVLPKDNFMSIDRGCIKPTGEGATTKVVISQSSDRLQILKPFPPLKADDFNDMFLLIKVKGKCTTDHISMAGEWLKYRGHLENISNNLLMGATNFFNDKTDSILNQLTGDYDKVSSVAKDYKSKGISSIVIAEDNYGEGSSREHAAMEPRFLNVKLIVAKSFARIHETNLKKQGVLAVTFNDARDYDKICENDKISISKVGNLTPNKLLEATIYHTDGSEDIIELKHTYNEQQVKWFKSGSALNSLS